MATKKISQLEAITEAEDSDVLVIVDVSEGTTNKITKGNLLLGSGHSIELTLDPQTYQLVLKLKNAAGTELSTQSVDLPNENAVTGIEYENGILTITKQVGEPSTVDLSPLIEGLVTESDFNTFTQTLAETIQGINETIGAINVKNGQQDEAIEENYKVINKLKSKVAEQEEIINQMPQVSGEGESVTLNNTIKAPFTLFSPEGHSEQESTEGYQMLDTKSATVDYIESGITLTKNEDGSLKTNTTTEYLKLNVPNTELEAGTYTFVRNFGGNHNSILKDSENNTIASIGYGETYKTITLTEEKTITVYQGAMLSTNCYFILYKGAYDSSKAYEPYTNGASPNPSYEQPIKSAGENVNLLNYSTIEKGDLDTSTGEVIPNSSVWHTDYMPVKSDKNYIINSDNTATKRYFLLDSEKNVISTATFSTKELTITTTSTTKYVRLKSVNSNFGEKAKLEPGTKATPYSPFGMGSITEKIVNRNFLSFTENTISYAGVTTNISETKMKFNGKMASVNNIFNTIREDKTIPAGTYKLSYKKLSGATSGSGAWAIYFRFFNANGTILLETHFASNEIATTEDLVLSEDVAYYNYYAFCNSTSLIFNDLELGFMITKDTATDYVPHEEQTYSIYTQQPFRSIGNVRDVFFKNTVDSPYYDENLVENGWYERHFINRVILDGTENWQVNGHIFYLQIDDKIQQKLEVLSNNYKYSSLHWSNMDNYQISTQANNTFIFIRDDNYSTTTNFKAYLAEQYANGIPVYIDYLSQEPTLLLCTTEQTNILENILKSFSGQTNVFSIDEVKAYLRAKGLKDLNTLDSDINNVKQAIVALGGVV